MTYRITLGSEKRLTALYSHPNQPNSTPTLGETVLHWFRMTLERDGLAPLGATADVRIDGAGPAAAYTLELDGPPALAASFATYRERLPRFLDAGEAALTKVVPRIKKEKRWDPSPEPENYRPWRFFLPLGLPLLNQRSLQFFHYPPIRLLEGTRDYLEDPVPRRWEELLKANGVRDDAEARLYETVVDATPIAAEDAQGSKKAGDPTWGLIPIQDFHDYQRALVKLLLNPAPVDAACTIPIVVFGSHPRDTFAELYLKGAKVKPSDTVIAEILPGRKTAVLFSRHPYAFYAEAQGFDDVGRGSFRSSVGRGAAEKLMRQDLITARWQMVMAAEPGLDPQKVRKDCEKYWKPGARDEQFADLVEHQGSLCYPRKDSLAFEFKVAMRGAGAPAASVAT